MNRLTLSNFHVQGASVGVWEKAWAEEDKDGTSDERSEQDMMLAERFFIPVCPTGIVCPVIISYATKEKHLQLTGDVGCFVG